MTSPAMPEDVHAVFQNYSPAVRERLATLRDTIFDVAARTDGVGALEETLKWGQISYLTPKTKSGSTIRIDADAADDEQVALFVHCQTTLIDTFRQAYGDLFEFEGNRCVRFNMNGELPIQAVEHCIALALTYHLRKKQRA